MAKKKKCLESTSKILKSVGKFIKTNPTEAAYRNRIAKISDSINTSTYIYGLNNNADKQLAVNALTFFNSLKNELAPENVIASTDTFIKEIYEKHYEQTIKEAKMDEVRQELANDFAKNADVIQKKGFNVNNIFTKLVSQSLIQTSGFSKIASYLIGILPKDSPVAKTLTTGLQALRQAEIDFEQKVQDKSEDLANRIIGVIPDLKVNTKQEGSELLVNVFYEIHKKYKDNSHTLSSNKMKMTTQEMLKIVAIARRPTLKQKQVDKYTEEGLAEMESILKTEFPPYIEFLDAIVAFNKEWHPEIDEAKQRNGGSPVIFGDFYIADDIAQVASTGGDGKSVNANGYTNGENTEAPTLLNGGLLNSTQKYIRANSKYVTHIDAYTYLNNTIFNEKVIENFGKSLGDNNNALTLTNSLIKAWGNLGVGDTESIETLTRLANNFRNASLIANISSPVAQIASLGVYMSKIPVSKHAEVYTKMMANFGGYNKKIEAIVKSRDRTNLSMVDQDQKSENFKNIMLQQKVIDKGYYLISLADKNVVRIGAMMEYVYRTEHLKESESEALFAILEKTATTQQSSSDLDRTTLSRGGVAARITGVFQSSMVGQMSHGLELTNKAINADGNWLKKMTGEESQELARFLFFSAALQATQLAVKAQFSLAYGLDIEDDNFLKDLMSESLIAGIPYSSSIEMFAEIQRLAPAIRKAMEEGMTFEAALAISAELAPLTKTLLDKHPKIGLSLIIIGGVDNVYSKGKKILGE